MQLLSFENILELDISPQTIYSWICQSISQKNDTILPPKISLKPEDEVFYNFMPSILLKEESAGLKIVNRYPNRSPVLDSQIFLYNIKNGNLECIMDGNFITAMRTGAIATHSIISFAKNGFNSISFIGVGIQARATLKIFSCMYDKRDLVIKVKKYKNQHLDFIAFAKQLLPQSTQYIICNTYDECVENTDIIISSVTYFENDICSDDKFSNGCLVVPIHTRGFTNCDLFFDKIYVDDLGHVSGFKHFNKFQNKAIETASYIKSPIELGRKSQLEKIICYNIGLSIHDLFIAKNIHKLAIANNVGQEIPMSVPNTKFWLEK
ncbi:hypothetical protein [Providencia sp. PROV201]|uniref:hypothetical protein n=1 Tax=Providencia sp. PROV201 TaxID=2949901 RepID=UPI00234949D8|nr:hypothetical protein [Providencia sp. PROV201]